MLKVLHERCCGLDVHKKSVTACSITPEGKEIKTFGTMTDDILALVEWITSKGCTHVAMESTGVYWKPVYNLLELEEIETLVVNAKHIKAVPGRKTDVKDAEWIADLLRHGLLRGSYIPSRDQRELRELVRYRKKIIEERAREVSRMQKILEGANIKLSSVATDIMGVSGKAIIQALVNGIENPEALSELAKGRMRDKKDELVRSLKGLVGPHQKLILSAQLDHIAFLDQQISELNKEIDNRMLPFEEALQLLDTIPGVGKQTAENIVAEIGTDMSRFPTAAHLSSWAGMSPGNNESAGKRKSGRTVKANPYLRTTLVEAARAASRSKNTYLNAQYHRIAARRGSNRAAVAVGHTILVICYYILKTGNPYYELGADYFDRRREGKTIKNAVRKLESLGYTVQLEKNIA